MNDSGTYIGDAEYFRGEHALLSAHPDKPGMVLAQFDSHDVMGAYGWLEFSADDFVLDEPIICLGFDDETSARGKV